MENEELEIELVFIESMANVLLKQAKDIRGEIDKLKRFPAADLLEAKEKLKKIGRKLSSAKKVLERN